MTLVYITWLPPGFEFYFTVTYTKYHGPLACRFDTLSATWAELYITHTARRYSSSTYNMGCSHGGYSRHYTSRYKVRYAITRHTVAIIDHRHDTPLLVPPGQVYVFTAVSPPSSAWPTSMATLESNTLAGGIVFKYSACHGRCVVPDPGVTV